MIVSALILVVSIFSHFSETVLSELPGGKREAGRPSPDFYELTRNVEIMQPSGERQLMSEGAFPGSKYDIQGMETRRRKVLAWKGPRPAPALIPRVIEPRNVADDGNNFDLRDGLPVPALIPRVIEPRNVGDDAHNFDLRGVDVRSPGKISKKYLYRNPSKQKK